jgi:hypothetical protein
LKLTKETQEVLDRLVDCLTKEFDVVDIPLLAGHLQAGDKTAMMEYCKERMLAIYESKNSGLQS